MTSLLLADSLYILVVLHSLMKHIVTLERPTGQGTDGSAWPKTRTYSGPQFNCPRRTASCQWPHKLGCGFFPSWDFRQLQPKDILIAACERPQRRRLCLALPGYLTHRNYEENKCVILAFVVICYAAIYA